MSVSLGTKRTLYFDLIKKTKIEGIARILKCNHIMGRYGFFLVKFEGESITKWRRIYTG